MTSKSKKLLLIAVLLLLATVTFTTYAIYRSSTSASASVGTAAWAVKVNGTNIETHTFTINPATDITWTTNTSAVSGKIAPGSSGTIDIEIDATGSEVDVDYTATIDSITIGGAAVSNSGFTVAVASGSSLTGTINYAATNMKATIRLAVTWTGSNSDNSTKDNADLGMAGSTVTIPVTVTAKQHLGS